MSESLFNKVAGLTPILKNICQRLLLHCTHTTQYPFYFIFSAFFLISATTVKISDVCFSFTFKRNQSIWIWYLIFNKSLPLVLFPFSMFFLSLSVLFHFFLSLLIRRILLSWELIKMFLPPLTSLKYVHANNK